jgi:hypothetical protein
MSNSDYLPRKDKDLLAWVTNFLAILASILPRIEFPAEVHARLTTLLNTFRTKLGIAEAPATRTKAAVKDKNLARDALEKETRQAIKEHLNFNHLVTEVDRENLGLPIYKTTRDPSPVATTYPAGRADTSMLRRITIHFADQSDGEETARAKPVGQHGAEIRWAISDTPIVDVEDLTHSSFDTRTPFTLEFKGHERGKTIYFCLCWENTRGEKGPWSPIESAIIP